MSKVKTSLVVLISGNGSNLQAIIDAADAHRIPVVIQAVISNNDSAFGLQRASSAGIPTIVIDHKIYPGRANYEQVLIEQINRFSPGLIVLAGFMRILSPDFVNQYQYKVLNIHPSLLPKYKGLNSHRRVIENQDSVHGATVHFVTPDLDSGPIIIQGHTPVEKSDTPESLQHKVHRIEHEILPKAIAWYADGRLSISNGRVLLDGEVNAEQGLETFHTS